SMQGRTYKYMTEEPRYPFGFGLTYSKIELSQLSLGQKVLQAQDSLKLAVTVKNVGNFDVEEVIQLYLSPVDTSGGIPLKSLKAFSRVSLKQGEEQSLSFALGPDELRVIDQEGVAQWRKGQYKVVVGNASPGELSIRLGAAVPQTAVIQLK
ncbi:MAG: fibronectin type III-like domain-contianing protein, partial [Bacteroidota bacterium]